MISIAIEGVKKRFGDAVALAGVDLKIEPGELFFLLGPSGCGKTTLLRSLAGFYVPDAGSVHFDDKDVTKVPPYRRNTGMMFQSYALWPHMTVAQNVAFGLEQRQVRREEREKRVREALDSVQMGAYGDRKPNQLSGGQQQRIALARALVVRPQCLLLDEPLSNLDAKLRLEMRAEIRRVCKAFNLTTVYVTHDQKEALSTADRMAILEAGHIRQVGTPIEVYRRPKTRFVADFIGETNFLGGTVKRAVESTVLVETELGELTGVPGDGVKPLEEGQEVTVSIRPECIRLETVPVDENCFGGEIGDAVYYGELAQYRLEVEERTLKVFEMNPRFAARVSGDPVYAWVDPDDVVVLAK